jgi:Tfp pilus assembly protein PilF
MKQYGTLLFIALIIFLISRCKDAPDQTEYIVQYRNHSDSAKYIGMEACKACHIDKYESFIKTGMGQSFGLATKSKSAGDYSHHQAIFDASSNLWYSPQFIGEQLYIKEFRLGGKDTVYSRNEPIKYIIGSGHHTNSHLIEENGYIYQAPLTFYTQTKQWDLPPGFEQGQNSRFSRIIGHECMSCHNSLPTYVEGSENKFTQVPTGIGCERCHGPGSIHVEEKKLGHLVDTKKEIDYTIVNPAKLPFDRQIDVCQRCHLQGNTVLKTGKNWQDFRPGMKLSDYMDVYMPKIIGNEDHFIMASHAQRLQMSKCFMQTQKQTKNITCITCHNPHVSVKETANEIYNKACEGCHDAKGQKVKICVEPLVKRQVVNNTCWKCHMPKNGTDDIPHVTVTDHYIRKVNAKEQIQKPAANDRFGGLGCINNTNPTHYSKAVAYLNAFEKFNNRQHTLDSASYYIQKLSAEEQALLNVRLYFLKEEYSKVNDIANVTATDAWTCYRKGKALIKSGQVAQALSWFRACVKIAPTSIEFQMELADALAISSQYAEAKIVYIKVIELNGKNARAHCNLAYIYKVMGDMAAAEKEATVCLQLDPDSEAAMQHLIDIYSLSAHTKKLALMKRRLAQLKQLQAHKN